MVRCSLISQCRSRYQKSIFRDVFQYAAGADGRLLDATPNLKYKAMFALMYSSGLRVSEVIHLNYEDISRTNMQIDNRNSKTHSSRYAILSKRALDILTEYWFKCGKPKGILFPNQWTGEYLTPSATGLEMRKSVKKAGLSKDVHSHCLRHGAFFHPCVP